MKKLLTIVAFLCASMVGWATQYCGETSPNANFTFSLMNVSGNLYRIQFDAIGDDKFASTPYNVNCGVNQTGGAGIFFGGDNSVNWVMTDDRAYYDFSTASESSVPSGFYGNYFCFNKKGGGLIEINGFDPSNVDWTATCGGSCTDEVAPTVSAVSVGSITYNSAVLSISASDNVAVTRYVVKNGSTQIGAGTSNEITLTGLSSGTTYNNINVYAYDACNNESSAFSVDDFTTDIISYCRYATGHLGNAAFGDANGRILLTIRKISSSSVGVKVEPNNGGSDVFDYVQVILNGVGKDLGSVGGSDPTNTEIVYESLASLNFSLNVLWHHSKWADAGGRWTTNAFDVAEAELCTESLVSLSTGSEYCEEAVPCTRNNGAYAYLSWQTTEDGDVIISISDGAGSTNAAFRGNGFEGNFDAGFSVLSGENFATSEVASKYFNRILPSGDKKTFTLQRKGGAILPSPTKIKFTSPALAWKCDQDGDAYTYPTFVYTYGKTCEVLSGFAVSASVNDAAMGSATATVAGEEVERVDAGTTVTFTATANDSYVFVNWTNGSSVVSTSAVYEAEINAATALVANFDYIRTTYCHTQVTSTAGKKFYLTLGSIGGGQYQIKFEGSSEAKIIGINDANFQINGVSAEWDTDGVDVPFSKANGAWTFDDSGNGTVYTTFELAAGKTWKDIYAWTHYMYFACDGLDQQILTNAFPDRYRIAWNEGCSDTEAPIWNTCTASSLSSTSVRISLQAIDNFDGTLTYTIARDGEDNIVLEGASGEQVTRDITGLTSGTEYTFEVTVSDGFNTTAVRSLTITPSGDTQSPVITSFTATPSYGHVDLAITATDDVAGELTYTITYGEMEESVVGAAGSEVTKRISALPNTSMTFRVTATDAADHVSAVAVANAHTLAIPASPKPIHNEGLVRSVYSDEYTAAVASNFWRRNFGGAELIAETDYMLYRMGSNVIVWGNNDGNAGYGNIDGLDGYTYGGNPGLNVSEMQYLHFDVWCDVAGQLNTVNINDQTISIPTTRTVAGEWVSFDVEISGVAEGDRQNLRWMKFHPFNTSNCLVAIDNVYFWNYGVKTTNDEDGYGWASFASAEKVQIPASVTGYFAEYQNNSDGEVLLLHEITDGIIPAEEGVLLRGTGNAAFAFSKTTETPATDFTNNSLEGCTERTDISDLHEDYDIFCLRRSDLYEMSGFFLYTGQYIPAGKAYLKLPKQTNAPAGAARRVRFVFDTATSLEPVEMYEVTKFIENGQMFIRRGNAVYTIQGTRVK